MVALLDSAVVLLVVLGFSSSPSSSFLHPVIHFVMWWLSVASFTVFDVQICQEVSPGHPGSWISQNYPWFLLTSPSTFCQSMKELIISPSSSGVSAITPSLLSTLHLLSEGHPLMILIKPLILMSDNPYSISRTLSYAKLLVVISLPKRHWVIEASNVSVHFWIVGWNQTDLDRSVLSCHWKVMTILFGALPTAASLNFLLYCFVSIQVWVEHYAEYV